ncbi:MAG TPA: lysylphosphatidylglycerol synthase transmembrane domain-containing protein [Gemmatimonadales bacterium]|nr:lysylphosphatidylglycerol synthase transmembrane domain-containing protein [Gemmatimonadales bacterium]
MTSRRGWARAIAGLAVAALFLALLARRVDWAEVRQVLAGARWWPLALGLVALAADMSARIVRWWWMLRAAEPGLPLLSCVRPFLGSLALNNTVPLRAGDVVRVFGFRHALRAPAAHVAGTLVLERMLDLLVLLAILFAGAIGTSGVFPHGFIVLAGFAGTVAVVLLLTLTIFPREITALLQRLLLRIFSGRKWLPRLSQAVAQLTGSVALLRSPPRAIRLIGLSILAWILEGAVFASVVWSLGIAVPWTAPWLSLAAATLATLLPSSPGYVGTFDYFAVLGLSAYGARAADATAFALLTHLMLWIPITVTGLLALGLSRPRSNPASVSDSLSSQSGAVA